MTKQQIDLGNELIPTINPEALTLADWKLIADIQNYKVSWVYKAWVQAKGNKFIQAVGIDNWINFATFLGYGCNWATQRYMEFKNKPGDEEVA